MHGRSPLELCVYWGWLPDSDAGATHWVSPARTHAWRKLPRCRECVSSLAAADRARG
ncbi:hypothetical protein [Amycolatopsis methanolica]|uniref:hypothetical protein n=1 Tax=Amycolatopsis methanolica TaxID=1814 RepID=UPI0012E00688|nr:hypothetical protein [Amycolatopsis methanolica]